MGSGQPLALPVYIWGANNGNIDLIAMICHGVIQELLRVAMKGIVRQRRNLWQIFEVRPYFGIKFTKAHRIVIIGNNAGARKMDEEAWSWTAEQTGDQSIERGLVVGISIV